MAQETAANKCGDNQENLGTNKPLSTTGITNEGFKKSSGEFDVVFVGNISEDINSIIPSSDKMKAEEARNRILDVDEYLVQIGEFGKAQKIILLLMYLMYIPHSYHMISTVFTGHSPAWKCKGLNEECNLTGTFDVGDQFYENRCSMNRSSWEYVETTSYTIVTEWDLICEKKVYPFISSSMLWCGWAIGAIIFGWATNRFGRKIILFLSWTLMVSAKFSCAVSTHFWMFAAFEFVAGFAQGGVALVSSVIVSELVGPRYRSMAGAGLGMIHTVSVCLMAMQGWFLLNWRHFLMVTTAPFLILLFSYKYIPESFRWLRINNRLNEAEEILQKLCKINGKDLPKSKLKPVEENMNTVNSSSVFKYKYKSILLGVIIQCLIWFINGQVFIGISMAADQLGGSIFRDFILANLIGLPAAYVAVIAMNKFGRKPTLMTAFGAACLSCVAITLIHPESEYVWGRIGSGMFGTLCMTIAFFGMYIWSLEILPTVIRSQGMGITSLVTRLGACSAPWVAQMLEHVHHTLSFSILGGAAFLAAVLCTTLPETLGKPTAETLEDAIRKAPEIKKDTNDIEMIANKLPV